MILNVLIGDKWRYAETWPEMSGIIDEVMENLEFEGTVVINGVPWETPGDVAKFSFSDRRHDGNSEWPDNFLVAGVNRASGYGGLIWYVFEPRSANGGINVHPWVSDNPQPPDVDPRVIAEPCGPDFFDPRSTVPLTQVRAALEEFCRTGTGDRPRAVEWVASSWGGRRIDAHELEG